MDLNRHTLVKDNVIFGQQTSSVSPLWTQKQGFWSILGSPQRLQLHKHSPSWKALFGGISPKSSCYPPFLQRTPPNPLLTCSSGESSPPRPVTLGCPKRHHPFPHSSHPRFYSTPPNQNQTNQPTKRRKNSAKTEKNCSKELLVTSLL